MSIDLISAKPIEIEQLRVFDFQGIYVDSAPDSDSVILTDGINYLWATATFDVLFGGLDRDGHFQIEKEGTKCVLFSSYAGNRPEKIIAAVEAYFGTKLISEHDDIFSYYITYD